MTSVTDFGDVAGSSCTCVRVAGGCWRLVPMQPRAMWFGFALRALLFRGSAAVCALVLLFHCPLSDEAWRLSQMA